MNAADYAQPRRRPSGEGLTMVVMLAVMTVLLALLLVLGSEAAGRPSFVYSVFMFTSTALAACGALLSRGEFVAARQWLRARVAPMAGLQRAQRQHLRQLLSIWVACAAPMLLVSQTAAQAVGGPAGLALLMAGIATIAEWSQLQKPRFGRAWAAWAAHWNWLDGTGQTKFSSLSFLPLVLMLTGSPDTAHSGLPQWGETLDSRYLLRLIALTLIALPLLQSPDLHWRHLLAPGARRRHIGRRILWFSFKGNFYITAVALALGLAVDAALGGKHWAHLPTIAAGLLPDLLLATMVAVTLRGFSGSQTATVMNLLLITLALALIAWVLHVMAISPTWHREFANPTWQREGWHALAMAAAMLALLPLMQRAWLRADLVLLAAKAKEPPEPTGWER